MFLLGGGVVVVCVWGGGGGGRTPHTPGVAEEGGEGGGGGPAFPIEPQTDPPRQRVEQICNSPDCGVVDLALMSRLRSSVPHQSQLSALTNDKTLSTTDCVATTVCATVSLRLNRRTFETSSPGTVTLNSLSTIVRSASNPSNNVSMQHPWDPETATTSRSLTFLRGTMYCLRLGPNFSHSHFFFTRMIKKWSVKNKHPAKTKSGLNSDLDLSNGGPPPPREREGWPSTPPELLSSRRDAAKARAAAQPSVDNHRSRHTCSTRFLRIRGSLLTFALASKRTSSDHLFLGPERPSPTVRPRAFLPASCNRQDSAIQVSNMTVRRSVGVKG